MPLKQITIKIADIAKLRKLPGVNTRDTDSLLVRAAVYLTIHKVPYEEALDAVYEPMGRKKNK